MSCLRKRRPDAYHIYNYSVLSAQLRSAGILCHYTALFSLQNQPHRYPHIPPKPYPVTTPKTTTRSLSTMADHLTGLFDNKIYDGRRKSLVYLALPNDTALFDSICDVTLSKTILAHLENFHCSKITAGTPEFAEFVAQYPLASAPSFIIFDHNLQRVFAAEDAPAQFLAFLQQKGDNTTDPAANSACTQKKSPGNGGSTDSDARVALSIRLPSGETVQGTFDASNTLKFVGRWLEREHNVLLASEKESNPNYSSGLPEPLRYAFFCPGTRVTFCEGQEFCQLKALGLSPRLALILKPEYDTRALEANANYSMLLAAQSKVTAMLHALYSFFDYGVDDAQRDLQSMTKDDLPIAFPGYLPMDPANRTSNPIIHPAIDVDELQPEYLAEEITRQGTPVRGMLDTLA